MRIALDYWPGATHEPGVGRYLREFGRALGALDDGPELALLDWGPGARLASAADPAKLPARVRCKRVKLPRSWLARLLRLGIGFDTLAGACDLVHGALAGEALPVRAACSLAISAPPRDVRALERYDGLLVFSQHARAELSGRHGMDPARVHVVPVGCEHFAVQRIAPSAAQPLRVLALGRVERSRAPLELLAACERLNAGGLQLELSFLGRAGDAYDELRARATRSRMSSRVRFDSAPDDAKVRAALATCTVLAQLADGDWTAVTPLEALASGAALVATHLPAYVEALGAHARWVDPGCGPEALAAALEAACADSRDLSLRRARAELAARFTWKRNAEGTLAAWRSMLGDGPTPA